MQILFADNHIIVAEKSAGISTEGEEGCLEDLVKAWAKEHYEKKGAVFLKAVHRLDKPASGIVVFAKTSKALSRLHTAFRERLIFKKYLALIEGILPKDEGVLEDFLLREEYRSSTSAEGEGKKASLSYKVLARHKDTTLVEVDLHTGRYHQIRVQFSLRGHPIVGDHKYGAKTVLQGKKIALHHQRIEFFHPVSQERCVFTSEPKEELLQFAPHLKQRP